MGKQEHAKIGPRDIMSIKAEMTKVEMKIKL